MEILVGADFLDSNRDMHAMEAVINKLLGPLIHDLAGFGQRPVTRLWQSRLNLNQTFDRIFNARKCQNKYNNQTIACMCNV